MQSVGWYSKVSKEIMTITVLVQMVCARILDLTDQIDIAASTDSLIENLNTLITAGRLTESNRIIISNYINSYHPGPQLRKNSSRESHLAHELNA